MDTLQKRAHRRVRPKTPEELRLEEICFAGLQKALAIAGGPAGLARRIGAKDRRNVHAWVAARRVPAEHVAVVARRCKMKKAELRPDVFG